LWMKKNRQRGGDATRTRQRGLGRDHREGRRPKHFGRPSGPSAMGAPFERKIKNGSGTTTRIGREQGRLLYIFDFGFSLPPFVFRWGQDWGSRPVAVSGPWWFLRRDRRRTTTRKDRKVVRKFRAS
jgi:hypothetical protein